MDGFVILIIVLVVGAVLLNLIFWGAIAFFFVSIFRGIARSEEQFQAMSPDEMVRTLMYLQQHGKLGQAQQYYGSVDGPIQSEIGSIAASQGWDPSSFSG